MKRNKKPSHQIKKNLLADFLVSPLQPSSMVRTTASQKRSSLLVSMLFILFTPRLLVAQGMRGSSSTALLLMVVLCSSSLWRFRSYGASFSSIRTTRSISCFPRRRRTSRPSTVSVPILSNLLSKQNPVGVLCSYSSKSSASASASSSFDSEKITRLQTQISQNLEPLAVPLQQLPLERDQEDISAFVEHQRQVFDELAEWFASDEAIPADLVPVYEYLTNQILESIIDALPERSPEDADSSNSDTRHSTIRLLDVGCGTGALFPFYDQAIRTYNQERHPGTEWKFHITGLDLSPNMIAKANEKVTSIHSINTASHFDLVVGDIGQFSISSEDDRDHPRYDAVVFNAVFGNFWKPRNVLEHVAIQVLRPHGRVSHIHSVQIVSDNCTTPVPKLSHICCQRKHSGKATLP